MVESPLSDMLAQVKNAYMARKKTAEIPYTKNKEQLAKILLNEGYLSKVETIKKKSSSNKKAIDLVFLLLSLKYAARKPILEGVRAVSKPSLRVYVKKGNIPRVLGGRGLVVLSTPKGLMTGSQAKKLGLGGELLCKIW